MLEGLFEPRALEDVPQLHRLVPAAARELGVRAVEAQAHHRAQMPVQHIQEPPRLQRPDVDVEWVQRACHHDLAARVNGTG